MCKFDPGTGTYVPKEKTSPENPRNNGKHTPDRASFWEISLFSLLLNENSLQAERVEAEGLLILQGLFFGTY